MEKRFTSIDPEIGIGKVVQIRAHVWKLCYPPEKKNK
jgi:hypothetical protein